MNASWYYNYCLVFSALSKRFKTTDILECNTSSPPQVHLTSLPEEEDSVPLTSPVWRSDKISEFGYQNVAVEDSLWLKKVQDNGLKTTKPQQKFCYFIYSFNFFYYYSFLKNAIIQHNMYI